MSQIGDLAESKGGNAKDEEENEGAIEKSTEEKDEIEKSEALATDREAEAEAEEEKHMEKPSEAATSAGPPQTLYKEYATRVAQVMRTYLGGGEEGSGGSTSSSPRGKPGLGIKDRCKAMMEVVRKQHDKWVVTKLETEHNHSISQNSEDQSAISQNTEDQSTISQNSEDQNTILPPTVGLEFESVEAAKVFYNNYGEKLGFKTCTGLNRRSAGSGALTMQRFVCYKGNYINNNNNNNKGFIGLRKKSRVDEEGPVAKRTRGKRGKLDVIELESSEEGEEEKDETESDYEEEGSSSKGKKGKEKGRKKKRVDGSDEVPSNSSLLYRLVRVPHHNNEERRRILLKYLNKRRNRGLFERPKIASRQIAAQNRKRVGGRFVTSQSTPTQKTPKRRYGKRQTEVTPSGQGAVPAYTLMYWPVYSYQGLGNAGTGTSTPSKSKSKPQPRQITYKENDTPEPDPTTEITASLGSEPKIGMVFESEEKAHEFYSKYAIKIGFTIRKGWWDRANRSVTKSRSFVCSKEGYRPRSAGSSNPKRPPPETRTNCGAHMTIKITVSGKYVVKEFVSHHNHELEPLLMDIQALRRNNLLKKVVKKPKEKESSKGKEIVVRGDLESEKEKEMETSIYIPPHYRNYVRVRRKNGVMPSGDAGVICEYLQRMKGQNPSFFYAIQLDESDQLMNIFWADSKSINDYHYFGDVVCFDTRYKIENYNRPLALFLGVNHHRQIVIFGAALLYDESNESIKWLFETFKSAMCGKQPKTVLTDQGEALTEAVLAVWPGTVHWLSVLHIYQNATRVLEHVFRGNESFAGDFARCLYGCEEESELVSSWDMLLEKYELKENDWLKKLYTDKEKWSLVYGRHVFTADIITTLQNDNSSVNLMEYLKPEVNISIFFKQFERFVEEKRFSEQQADHITSQGLNRIQNLRLLWQAINVYTPSVFELFRIEFDLFLTCMVFACSEAGMVSEYEVTVKEKPRGHFVRYNASDLSAICSCRKFESVGIPCCHVLKIYDFKNMKDLPPQYILRRWRKDAKMENLRENHGLGFDDDPKSSLAKRYGSLLRILYRVAERACENQEAYEFMEGQSEQLIEQVERILQARVLDKGGGKAIERILGAGGEGTSGENKRKKKSRKTSVNNNINNNLNGGAVGVELSGGGKRKKARQGVSEETHLAVRSEEPPPPTGEIMPPPSRNPASHFLTPTQLMQAPYVPTPQQYGLGSMQGFHGMTQFNQMQDSSASLQQQVFHSTTQMTQGIPPPPDMQSLQFLGNPPLVGTNQQMVGTNQQLGHQNADQAHYTIPVWDFL